MQIWIARAFINKGFSLNALGRKADATATFDEMLKRFEDSTAPELQELVVNARLRKGAIETH